MSDTERLEIFLTGFQTGVATLVMHSDRADQEYATGLARRWANQIATDPIARQWVLDLLEAKPSALTELRMPGVGS